MKIFLSTRWLAKPFEEVWKILEILEVLLNTRKANKKALAIIANVKYENLRYACINSPLENQDSRSQGFGIFSRCTNSQSIPSPRNPDSVDHFPCATPKTSFVSLLVQFSSELPDQTSL